MNNNSSWGQPPAAADGNAAGGTPAEAAHPGATGAPVDDAICADIARRMQEVDGFWQQLEAAATADVGPQRAKRFVAAFQQAHDKKVQAANLEQADQLAAQIFAALQQQQE